MDVLDSLANPAFGNYPALISEKRQFSFSELDNITTQLAHELLSYVNHGSTLILCCKNPVLHFAASVAAIKAGLCHSAVQPGSPARQIQQLANDIAANAIVSDFYQDGLFPQNLARIPLSIEQHLSVKKTETKTVSTLDRSAPALILSGSGTTGKARLLAIDIDNLNKIIKRDILARPLEPGDIHYSFTPIEFYTAKRRHLAYLQQGACIAFTESPDQSLSLINQHKIKHFSIASSHALELIELHVKHPQVIESVFSGSRSIFLGGSPISETIRQQINAFTNNSLHIAYGTNELGECAIANAELQKDYPQCVGKLLKGVELEILDQQEHILPAGNIGEARFRVEGQACVFEKNQKQQADKAQDWFYPRDKLSLNEDGVLFHHGRSDDAIIFEGVIIYPRDIEQIAEAFPGVKEAAALGLDINNNQVPVLAVYGETNINTMELSKELRKHLGWQAPKMVSQVSDMPKNSAGKILKREIKKAMMAALQNRSDNNQ